MRTLPTFLIRDIILYFSTNRDIYIFTYNIVKNILYFAINFGLQIIQEDTNIFYFLVCEV